MIRTATRRSRRRSARRERSDAALGSAGCRAAAQALVRRIRPALSHRGPSSPSAFGVSRATVREAIRRLRGEGLLEARRGSGTFVVQRQLDAPDTRHLRSCPGDHGRRARPFQQGAASRGGPGRGRRRPGARCREPRDRPVGGATSLCRRRAARSRPVCTCPRRLAAACLCGGRSRGGLPLRSARDHLRATGHRWHRTPPGGRMHRRPSASSCGPTGARAYWRSSALPMPANSQSNGAGAWSAAGATCSRRAGAWCPPERGAARL